MQLFMDLAWLLIFRLYPNLGLKAKITYIKGKDDEGFALRHVPPVYGDVAVVYQIDKLNQTLDAAFKGHKTICHKLHETDSPSSSEIIEVLSKWNVTFFQGNKPAYGHG